MKKTIITFLLIFIFTVSFTFNQQSILKPRKCSEQRMKWWSSLKFGMFIHWGPWSQTSKGRIWEIVDKNNFNEREKYFNLYKTFNPKKFNPKKWAELAKEAGMRYVVFTTKHHDGFNNYDTKLSDYKITSKDCPYHKNPNADITCKIVDAFRNEGLAIGLYYSHIDWHHHEGKYFSRGHWDFNKKLIEDNPVKWQRFANYEKGQVYELLTKYEKIDIFWFDIYWPTASYGRKIKNLKVRDNLINMVSMMRKLQPHLIINNRGTDLLGDFSTPEQKIPSSRRKGYWEVCMTISNGRGFWYKDKDAEYKASKELIHMLVDIVSQGGNFLLNIGPRPDGTLVPEEVDRLKKIGNWLRVNGESIYGTEPTIFNNSLEWGRCTVKGDKIYLHVFDWPVDGKLHVPRLLNYVKVKKVYVLVGKNRENLYIKRYGKDILINLGAKPLDSFVTVIVIESDFLLKLLN